MPKTGYVHRCHQQHWAEDLNMFTRVTSNTRSVYMPPITLCQHTLVQYISLSSSKVMRTDMLFLFCVFFYQSSLSCDWTDQTSMFLHKDPACFAQKTTWPQQPVWLSSVRCGRKDPWSLTFPFLSECQADISVAPLLTKRCETLCVGDRPPLSAVWWGSMSKQLHNSLPSSCWSNVPNLHKKEDILGDNKYKIIMFYPHAHSLCNIFLCTCYYLSKADKWIYFLRINKVLLYCTTNFVLF